MGSLTSALGPDRMADLDISPSNATDISKSYLFTSTQDWFSFHIYAWRLLFQESNHSLLVSRD